VFLFPCDDQNRSKDCFIEFQLEINRGIVLKSTSFLQLLFLKRVINIMRLTCFCLNVCKRIVVRKQNRLFLIMDKLQFFKEKTKIKNTSKATKHNAEFFNHAINLLSHECSCNMGFIFLVFIYWHSPKGSCNK
jgi:hypothetical protein